MFDTQRDGSRADVGYHTRWRRYLLDKHENHRLDASGAAQMYTEPVQWLSAMGVLDFSLAKGKERHKDFGYVNLATNHSAGLT